MSRSLSRSAQVLVKSLFRKSNFRKFFIPFSQKFLLLRSFWIMVSFSLNSSLYQIFRSWKPNFGHKSFKRVSTIGITQPDHCTCWYMLVKSVKCAFSYCKATVCFENIFEIIMVQPNLFLVVFYCDKNELIFQNDDCGWVPTLQKSFQK